MYAPKKHNIDSNDKMINDPGTFLRTLEAVSRTEDLCQNLNLVPLLFQLILGSRGPSPCAYKIMLNGLGPKQLIHSKLRLGTFTAE